MDYSSSHVKVKEIEENIFSRISSTVVYEIYIIFLVTSVETVMRMLSTASVIMDKWSRTRLTWFGCLWLSIYSFRDGDRMADSLVI